MNHPFINPALFSRISLHYTFHAGPPSPERTILLAIGKSAPFMTRRFLEEYPSYRSSPTNMVIPEELSLPDQGLPLYIDIVRSTHPHVTEKSFAAGRALLDFLRRHAAYADAVITLLSGGASALIEDADNPATVIAENRRLLYSGLPIQEVNRQRITLSRIKGGKLTDLLPEAFWITFVMSDIPSPDGYRIVGSMPTYREHHPRHTLIPVADGASLHELCAGLVKEHGYRIVFERRFLTGTVEEWGDIITKEGERLGPREAILLTGEPTIAVTVPSPGCGGRMAHLALLLVDSLPVHHNLYALSSDGIDGNSPYAGVVYTSTDRVRFDRTLLAAHRDHFDAYSFFERYGCALRTGYTGVNLNDVVVVTGS